MRLSQEPCLGVNTNAKRPPGLSGQPRLGFPRDVRRVIVQNDLDRSCGRVGRVEDIEELDELPTAMAVLDQRVHRASKQIDAGHQGHRAVALILVVALVVGWMPGTGGRSGVVLPIA